MALINHVEVAELEARSSMANRINRIQANKGEREIDKRKRKRREDTIV
jgi:hypothetical protein